MKFSERLYRYTEDIWNAYYEHPFVLGLADGTLEIERFKYYMIQDYLYLFDYIKLFAIGVLKAEDEELMKIFSGSLNLILDGEMDIHRGYMKRLGIGEAEVLKAKRHLTNLSYTNYMLSVSQKGGLEEVVAALLSCAWTYAEIAKKINEMNPEARYHEFYGDWVSGYMGEEFQDAAKWFIELIDVMGAEVGESKREELCQIFRNCCIYELNFWEMSWRMEE